MTTATETQTASPAADEEKGSVDSKSRNAKFDLKRREKAEVCMIQIHALCGQLKERSSEADYFAISVAEAIEKLNYDLMDHLEFLTFLGQKEQA